MSQAHLHDWQSPGALLKPVAVLEDWLGPVHCLVSCTHCHQYALIYLLAWQGPQLANRTFAVRPVAAEHARTYLQNIDRDYCDLSRKSSEGDALAAAAGPANLAIETRLTPLTVVAVWSLLSPPKQQTWQEIAPGDNEHWQHHRASAQ